MKRVRKLTIPATSRRHEQQEMIFAAICAARMDASMWQTGAKATHPG